MVRLAPLVVVIGLVLVACAAETAVSPDTTSEPATITSTTTTQPTTTTPTVTTTEAATTTTSGSEVDVEIRGGEVTGLDRFEYQRGEMVDITVVADTAYELHVHGYDLRFDLEPEVPFTIEFVADVPGIFEVETHPDHLLVFELEVGG